jgi:hypothetical protein
MKRERQRRDRGKDKGESHKRRDGGKETLGKRQKERDRSER